MTSITSTTPLYRQPLTEIYVPTPYNAKVGAAPHLNAGNNQHLDQKIQRVVNETQLWYLCPVTMVGGKQLYSFELYVPPPPVVRVGTNQQTHPNQPTNPQVNTSEHKIAKPNHSTLKQSLQKSEEPMEKEQHCPNIKTTASVATQTEDLTEETEAHRIDQRAKQICFGLAQESFITALLKGNSVQWPDPRGKHAKRAFDALVSKFRIKIHEYDNEVIPSEIMELQVVQELMVTHQTFAENVKAITDRSKRRTSTKELENQTSIEHSQSKTSTEKLEKQTSTEDLESQTSQLYYPLFTQFLEDIGTFQRRYALTDVEARTDQSKRRTSTKELERQTSSEDSQSKTPTEELESQTSTEGSERQTSQLYDPLFPQPLEDIDTFQTRDALANVERTILATLAQAHTNSKLAAYLFH